MQTLTPWHASLPGERNHSDTQARIVSVQTPVTEEAFSMLYDGVTEGRYQGWWWLASAPASRVAGTLIISSTSSSRIELLGWLLDPDQDALESDMLLGEVPTVGEVSIPHAVVSEWSIFADQTTQKITCGSIYIGAHLAVGARFTSATLITKVTYEWIEMGRARPDREGDPGRASISVTAPPWRTCTIEALGELTLSATPSVTSGRQGQGSITLTPGWHCELVTPLEGEGIWQRLVLPILELMTLVSGTGDDLASLWVTTEGQDSEREPIQWLTESSMRRVKRGRAPTFHEYLIRVVEVEGHWNDFLGKWFAMQESAAAPLLEFFSTYWYDMHAEEKFSRTVRALEVWHRRSSDRTQFSPDHFEQLLHEATSGIQAKKTGDGCLIA